ncbi:unnamed protein product [Allacma fusca]|uniref:Transposase n=1 Tax=Allacma fusca TaxID=39272 RepID=A0A8J2NY75_9HEXA|nr:unnamed protein product [Allacma fusca]
MMDSIAAYTYLKAETANAVWDLGHVGEEHREWVNIDRIELVAFFSLFYLAGAHRLKRESTHKLWRSDSSLSYTFVCACQCCGQVQAGLDIRIEIGIGIGIAYMEHKIKEKSIKRPRLENPAEIQPLLDEFLKIKKRIVISELTNPIFEALDLTINRRTIKALVDEEAQNQKHILKSILKNKLLSLKLDIASRHYRSFLAINVQYCHKDKLCVSTLAVKELHDRHTSDNIIQTLSKVLEDFEIRKGQIYSATTDNGSNFVKAFSDLDQDDINADILDDNNLDVNESEETTDDEINDECDEIEVLH